MDFYTTLGLAQADFIALVVFILLWTAYTLIADHSSFRLHSISYAMDKHRASWLIQASQRDLKIVDTSILGMLITGISFYASSTIFVIGGIIAAMGYAQDITHDFALMPFGETLTSNQLALRLSVMMAIFIYAFFKFAWAFRIANYTGIVIGGMAAVPERDKVSDANLKRAKTASDLSSLSGRHFNRGLRAYFFALGTVGWFISAHALIFTTLLIICILARREFYSKAVKLVREL